MNPLLLPITDILQNLKLCEIISLIIFYFLKFAKIETVFPIKKYHPFFRMIFVFICFIRSNRYVVGADEGTRTPTPLALVPKTSASTSSATSANLLNNEYNSTFELSLSSAFTYFIN